MSSAVSTARVSSGLHAQRDSVTFCGMQGSHPQLFHINICLCQEMQHYRLPEASLTSGKERFCFIRWRRLRPTQTIWPGGGGLSDGLHGADSFLRSQQVLSQEIHRILWNPKVHYRIYKWPPSDHILSHINRGHVCPSYFLKIHVNILLSTLRSSMWSPSLGSPPPKRCIHLSPHTCYIPLPSHCFWFDHPDDNWWGGQNVKLLLM
jgi:hypothetical protein